MIFSTQLHFHSSKHKLRVSCPSKHRSIFTVKASGTKGRKSKMEKEGFKILSEKVAYSRYLTIKDRSVQFPGRQMNQSIIHSFDVVSSRHPQFCVVFPFHPYTHKPGGEVTILSEYSQGLHSIVYCFPSGGYDLTKHDSILHCAKSELSEEAHLKGGEFHCLIPDGHPGIPEVKWCQNRFTPYLVINPEVKYLTRLPITVLQEDHSPDAQDPEEYIKIHRVNLAELKDLIMTKEVLPPTTVTHFLALEKLQQLNWNLQ